VASSRTSEHQQDDDEEMNIGGDASTPGEKFSGAAAPLDVVYVSNICYSYRAVNSFIMVILFGKKIWLL